MIARELTDVFNAVAIVVTYTLSTDARREKNTSGHRTRPFRSRSFKSLISSLWLALRL